MLPIIFCAVQPEDRKVLLASLDEMAQNGKEKVSVETVTDSPEDAARELDEYEKISAFTIGIGTQKREDSISGAQLGRKVFQKNRNHYLIYVLQKPSLLEKAAAILPHPFSILIHPLKPELTKQVSRRLLEDYGQISGGWESEDGIVIKDGGSCQILRKSSFLYAESSEKKTKITMREQYITTSMTMNELEEKLGHGFFRCHRSFIVSEEQIEKISFSELEIRLQTGERIPLSKRKATEAKEVLQRLREKA